MATAKLTEQQFLAQLKQLIEKSYADGIDRFLKWGAKDSAIVGQFADGSRVFEFNLSTKGLEYKPLSQQVATDSLSELFPELQSRHAAYREAFLRVRLDAPVKAGGKKRNCTSATSYSCGNSCINNKKACQISGEALNPQQVGILIDAGKGLGGNTSAKVATMEPPPMAGAMGKAGAIEAGANVSQIPVPIYTQFRNNYRRNFENTAQLAATQAKSIKVQDIGDKTQVTFTVGGFSTDAKGGERLAKNLKRQFRDHHFVPISNEEFDLDPEANLYGDRVKFARKAFGKLINTSLNQGYNPVALKVTAHAKAYRDAYPKAQINLIGHSAGGIASHEAAELLEKLDIKPKVAAIGSPYFGLTEPTENSITFASNKDPIVAPGNVMRPVWVNSVKGHGIEDYLSDKEVKNSLHAFLGSTEKAKRKDAFEDIETSSQANGVRLQRKPVLGATTRSLMLQLKEVLERVYTDGIDRFLDIKTDEAGNIQGLFRDGAKILEFSIKSGGISYRLAPLGRGRSDSWLEGYALESVKMNLETALRIDAPRTKPKCVKGIACGSACISGNKACQVRLNRVAKPAEILKLRQTAVTLTAEQATAAPLTSTTQPAATASTPDKFEGMSIRDLKKEASARGVYRYSEMTQQQLREAIRFSDANPEQQERLAKTVEQNRLSGGTTLRRFGVTTKGRETQIPGGQRINAEKSLVQSVRKWNRIQRIVKLANLDPSLAGAAVSAVIMGVSLQQYNKFRDRYRAGLPDSAQAAMERANKMNVVSTPRYNITFAVGGFKEEGSSGRKIKDTLESFADKEDATAMDRWWKDRNEIIPVETKEFQIGKIKSSKYNKDGTYNPLYTAELSQSAFGSYLRNFRRGRNDDAVELAAKIYAYANYRDPKQKYPGYLNDKKNINIVAHATGGNTVYEALEIVARMNSPRSRSGRQVLQRVNVVTLGTSDFGYTEKGLARERNITSAQDPFSLLPQRNEKWVSNVPGHEIKDYLNNDEVQDQLLQAFGYFDRTAFEYERRNPRRRSDF